MYNIKVYMNNSFLWNEKNITNRSTPINTLRAFIGVLKRYTQDNRLNGVTK